MPQWNRNEADPDRVRKLEMALENCFILAGRKRARRTTYHADGTFTPGEPNSDDADWDHITRFCKGVGLDYSILRTADTSLGQSPEVTAAKDRYDRVNDGEPLLSAYPGMGLIEACNACCADERLLFNVGVIPVSTCGAGD